MQIKRTESARSLRWIHGVMAGMYFLVLGMLLYFRLGPFRRVMARLETDGVDAPIWFSFVFTAGVGLVGLFLLWRALASLRRALTSPTNDETASS